MNPKTITPDSAACAAAQCADNKQNRGGARADNQVKNNFLTLSALRHRVLHPCCGVFVCLLLSPLTLTSCSTPDPVTPSEDSIDGVTRSADDPSADTSLSLTITVNDEWNGETTVTF